MRDDSSSPEGPGSGLPLTREEQLRLWQEKTGRRRNTTSTMIPKLNPPTDAGRKRRHAARHLGSSDDNEHRNHESSPFDSIPTPPQFQLFVKQRWFDEAPMREDLLIKSEGRSPEGYLIPCSSPPQQPDPMQQLQSDNGDEPLVEGGFDGEWGEAFLSEDDNDIGEPIGPYRPSSVNLLSSLEAKITQVASQISRVRARATDGHSSGAKSPEGGREVNVGKVMGVGGSRLVSAAGGQGRGGGDGIDGAGDGEQDGDDDGWRRRRAMSTDGTPTRPLRYGSLREELDVLGSMVDELKTGLHQTTDVIKHLQRNEQQYQSQLESAHERIVALEDHNRDLTHQLAQHRIDRSCVSPSSPGLQSLAEARLRARYEALLREKDEEIQRITKANRGPDGEELTETLREIQSANEELTTQLVKAHALNQALQRKYVQGEEIRSRLHAFVETLRGPIRVFVRVRPLIGREVVDHQGEPLPIDVLDVDDGRCVEWLCPKHMQQRVTNTRLLYQFDRVFSPEATQHEVYDVACAPLIQSALDGKRVAIFAYGQTGSGKTYTILGPAGLVGTEEGAAMHSASSIHDEGLIQRAVRLIWAERTRMEGTRRAFAVQVVCVELYNESCRDLLTGQAATVALLPGRTTGPLGKVDVRNIHPTVADTQEEVLDLLQQAAANRQTDRTHRNATSSRSHAVFQLRFMPVATRTSADPSMQHHNKYGSVSFVDLAGSERLETQQVGSKQLNEARSINLSLAHLAQCVTDLAQNNKHVNFRNSQLTWLLQDCLGSNPDESQCAFVVNLSPLPRHAWESKYSLNFAYKISLGIRAARNEGAPANAWGASV
ncbi:unnamed protein product [Vitrella brassicaformis CCMP3155]|uniref:Kinesin-like protein n=1 Tax=Vitrella brassicaformis (strain CCMP3155) TaxID=1169540 RepID=A0A0G4GU48_VITBC|nr:unnamed protein product [Vitrella brassicaformis CCMP3155]|eukprot:CEM34148.1 unnamed protein product [Vitrella brassicaformis CCMP3155]